MTSPGEKQQWDTRSITLKVNDISYAGSRRLDYRLRCQTRSNQRVILNIWSWSPAAELDWQTGEWYHLQDAVLKQNSDVLKLDANRDTCAELVAPPAENEIESHQKSSCTTRLNRCGFSWPDDYTGDAAVSEAPANCCYRENWRGYDRCIWHAETVSKKPVEELQAQRETPENRKLNSRPRELLTGATLCEGEIYDMVLTYVDFSGSDLSDLKFTDVYLGYANLSGTSLVDADLSDSTVSRTNFSDASLERANLQGTSLYGADFTNANLRDADLSNTTLRAADFTNAVLDGANLTDADTEEISNAKSYPTKDGSSIEVPDSDPQTTQTEESKTSSSTSSQNSGQGLPLTSVPGVGSGRSDALQKSGYTCVKDVASTSVLELSKVNKINHKTAHIIREAAKQLRDDDDTLAAQLSHELDVAEEDVQSAYSELAPINVSPSEAEQPLKIMFKGIDKKSVLQLDVGSYRLRYLLWNNGYQAIKDIEQASVGEISNVRYIQENDAEKIKNIAEAVVSGERFAENEESSKTGESVSEPKCTEKNETTTLNDSAKENSTQNSIPSTGAQTVIQFDETPLRRLVEAYTSHYDCVFSAENPQMDWRKKFARSYSSEVDDKTEHTPLTPDEIQQLLRRFIETDSSGGSVLSKLDGPLSHPKWNTLIGFVDMYPETASDVFTYLLQPDQPLFDRIGRFMNQISTDTFNAVGSEIENGTRSISTSPLLGLPTTILMFSFPEKHISYQYWKYKDFFNSYSDYNVESAGNTDIVSQYVELCSGTKTIKQQLDRFMDSPTMIDVRNIIRHHEELEQVNSDDTSRVSGLTDDVSSQSVSMDTENNQPTPNQLSEYYEAFRSIRNAIETVAVMEESDLRPNDRTQPAIQYYQLIASILNLESLPSGEFTGYGPQQSNRVSFGMPDYRREFGNETWITDYQSISVAPFRESSQRFFEEHQLVETTDALVRPVSPATNTPVPEIVETEEQLRDVIDILREFPAYPATPSDPNPSDKRIPVERLYEWTTTDIAETDTINVYGYDISIIDDESLQDSPVTDATPTTKEEVEDFLIRYEKLTHLFRRIDPPNVVATNQAVPVFALDWYEPRSKADEPSKFSTRLLSFAKEDKDVHTDHFRTRMRDLIHRRFLRDRWEYDYITVFPSHEAGRLSPPLVELARDAVLKTPVVYTPLLERTETTPRQRQRTHEERLEVAKYPKATLRVQSQLEDDTVIILDDVCTSGASLMAGAHLLRTAGAKRVIGLVLGITSGRHDVQEISSPSASVSEIIATREE